MAEKDNENNPYSGYERSKNINSMSRMSRRTSDQIDKEFNSENKIQGVHGKLDADNSYQKLYQESFESTSKQLNTYHHEEVGDTILDASHKDDAVKTADNSYSSNFSNSANTSSAYQDYQNNSYPASETFSSPQYDANSDLTPNGQSNYSYNEPSLNVESPSSNISNSNKTDSYQYNDVLNTKKEFTDNNANYSETSANTEYNQPNTHLNENNNPIADSISNEYSNYDYQTKTDSSPLSRKEYEYARHGNGETVAGNLSTKFDSNKENTFLNHESNESRGTFVNNSDFQQNEQPLSYSEQPSAYSTSSLNTQTAQNNEQIGNILGASYNNESVSYGPQSVYETPVNNLSTASQMPRDNGLNSTGFSANERKEDLPSTSQVTYSSQSSSIQNSRPSTNTNENFTVRNTEKVENYGSKSKLKTGNNLNSNFEESLSNAFNPTTHADAEAIKVATRGVDETVSGTLSTGLNADKGNTFVQKGQPAQNVQNIQSNSNGQNVQLSLFDDSNNSKENKNGLSTSLNDTVNVVKINNNERVETTRLSSEVNQTQSGQVIQTVQTGHQNQTTQLNQINNQSVQQQMNFKNGNIVDEGMSFETDVDAATRTVGGVTVTGEKGLKTLSADPTGLAPTITIMDDFGNETIMNVGETIMLSNGVMLEYNLNDVGEGVILSNFVENSNIVGKANNIKGTDTNLAGQWTTQTNVNDLENIKVSFAQDDEGNPLFVLNMSAEQKEKLKTLSTATDKATDSNGGLNVGDNKLKTTSKNTITKEDIKKAKTKKNLEKGATVLVRGAMLLIGSISTVLEGVAFDGPEAQFAVQKTNDLIKKGTYIGTKKAYNSKAGKKLRTAASNKSKVVIVNIGKALSQTSYGSALNIAKNKIQNKILNNRLYKKVFDKNGIGTKAGNVLGKVFGKSGALAKFFRGVKALKNTIRKYIVLAAGAGIAFLSFCLCASLVIASIQSTLFFWVDNRSQFEKMVDYVEEVNSDVDKIKNKWINNGVIPEKGETVSASLSDIVSNKASNIASYSEEGGNYNGTNISFDESGLKSFPYEGNNKVSIDTGIKSSDSNYISGEKGNYSSSDHNSDYSKMYINISKTPSNYYGNINGINWKAFWVLVQIYEVDTENLDKNTTEEKMAKIVDTTRKNPYGNFKSSWRNNGVTAEYSISRWVASHITAEINYTLYTNAKGTEVDYSKFTAWKSNLVKYNEGQVINAKKTEYENKIAPTYNYYVGVGDSLYNVFMKDMNTNGGAYAYIYGYSSTSKMKAALDKYFKQYSNITDKQYRKKLGLKEGHKADITPDVYASKIINKRSKKSLQEFTDKVKSKYENGGLAKWSEDLNLKNTYGELYTSSAMQKIGNYNSLKNANPNKAENRISPAYRIDYTLTDDGDQTLENYKDFMKNQYYKSKVQRDKDGNPIKNANGEVQKTYEAQTLDSSQNEMAEALYFNQDTAFDAFPDDLKEKMKSYCNINTFESLAMSSGSYPAGTEEQIKYVAALQVILNHDTFKVSAGQSGYMYPGVTVAQAMQESGIGTSKVSALAVNASNLFGMKYSKNGWGGLVIGSYHGSTAEWAQFESWSTCIQGRQDTIINKSTYSAIKNVSSANGQLTALSNSPWCEGGYSTLNNLYIKYGKKYDNLSYDEAKKFAEENKASTSNIIALAQTKIGCRYVWGASHSASAVSNPATTVFDCSSFVSWAYYQTGNPLPGVIMCSGDIGRLGSQPGWQQISIDKAQPGDILWKSGHVGLYAGNGQTVEAMGAKWGVCIGKASRFTYAIRKV